MAASFCCSAACTSATATNSSGFSGNRERDKWAYSKPDVKSFRSKLDRAAVSATGARNADRGYFSRNERDSALSFGGSLVLEMARKADLSVGSLIWSATVSGVRLAEPGTESISCASTRKLRQIRTPVEAHNASLCTVSVLTFRDGVLGPGSALRSSRVIFTAW